jgi:hypothetical protein
LLRIGDLIAQASNEMDTAGLLAQLRRRGSPFPRYA